MRAKLYRRISECIVGCGGGVAVPCACLLSGNRGIWLSTILMIGVSLCLTAGALMVLRWARRTGQFTDIEGVKYRMLMDDEEFARNNLEPRIDANSVPRNNTKSL